MTIEVQPTIEVIFEARNGIMRKNNVVFPIFNFKISPGSFRLLSSIINKIFAVRKYMNRARNYFYSAVFVIYSIVFRKR